jgi:hypothetical protein
MKAAFAEAFQRGAKSVVAIGTDCPAITELHLRSAFDALSDSDLVLGPARDGGYYLIGLNRLYESVFEAVPWGTPLVLERTLALAAEKSIRFHLLPMLSDVDVLEDLGEWSAHRDRYLIDGSVPQLSVIIPTLNEAAYVASAIDSARSVSGAEVIVVDGGSQDQTVELAVGKGATVLRSPLGRAVQMNAGAAMAKGRIFLFLHADTVLPAGYADRVIRGLEQASTSVTASRLAINAPGRMLTWIASVANWRSRWLSLPYGDQALAFRATDFRRLGGFPLLPILEDIELVRACRPFGRIKLLNAEVRTSPRRWLAYGVLSTTFRNQLCLLGRWLRFSPDRLARWRSRSAARTKPSVERARATLLGTKTA